MHGARERSQREGGERDIESEKINIHARELAYIGAVHPRNIHEKKIPYEKLVKYLVKNY